MDLGDRMKNYEAAYEFKVIPRCPAIVRVDGRAFHSMLRGCQKPFDATVGDAMDSVAMSLLSEIQGSRFAYVQSDEASILLIDYNKFNSDQWFGGSVQKMASVSASISSRAFSMAFGRPADFDSRVFSIPERDVANYFVWRQRDATRNSVQMVARSLYSHSQCLNKNASELQEMIFQKGQNWDSLAPYWKRGRVVTTDTNTPVKECPIFSNEPGFITKFMSIEEE